jgi:hypothetical protein
LNKFLKAIGILLILGGVLNTLAIITKVYVLILISFITVNTVLISIGLPLAIFSVFVGLKLFKLKKDFITYYKKYCYFSLGYIFTTFSTSIYLLMETMNKEEYKDIYMNYSYFDKILLSLEISQPYALIATIIIVPLSIIFFNKQKDKFIN